MNNALPFVELGSGLQNIHRGSIPAYRLTTTNDCARALGALQVILLGDAELDRGARCRAWRGQVNKRLTTA